MSILPVSGKVKEPKIDSFADGRLLGSYPRATRLTPGKSGYRVNQELRSALLKNTAQQFGLLD